MAAKFIQIASVFDPNDDAAIVFGLDAEGKVWEYVGEGWEPLDMKRLDPSGKKSDEGDSEEEG